ncbi:MAG: hypothetical protein ACFB0C_13430 [Leptolyngbyaceae cyanobacterium]
MSSSSSTALQSYADDAQIWNNLKTAIANSSGFKRWNSDQHLTSVEDSNVDALVRRYLRETLETLAY